MASPLLQFQCSPSQLEFKLYLTLSKILGPRYRILVGQLYRILVRKCSRTQEAIPFL